MNIEHMVFTYYTYDAFGNQTKTNGDIYNPFRYNGEYYDDETGYTYLRNRYYDSEKGRFISEDPIKDGLNWYSYCGGNPVMMVDPNGLTAYITNQKEVNVFKESMAAMTGYSVDDFSYNEETTQLTYIGDGTHNGGSEVGRELLTYLMSDETMEFLYYRSDNSNGGSSQGGQIYLAEHGGAKENAVVLGHEITHSMERNRGWTDYIIYAQREGSTQKEFETAKKTITKRYQEAVAITVEQQIAKDIGVNYDASRLSPLGEGEFPHILTSANVNTMGITTKLSKPLRDITYAGMLSSYSTGIVYNILHGDKPKKGG